jgi:hypothetical protein
VVALDHCVQRLQKSAGYNVVKQALKDALQEVTEILGGVDPAWFYTNVS